MPGPGTTTWGSAAESRGSPRELWNAVSGRKYGSVFRLQALVFRPSQSMSMSAFQNTAFRVSQTGTVAFALPLSVRYLPFEIREQARTSASSSAAVTSSGPASASWPEPEADAGSAAAPRSAAPQAADVRASMRVRMVRKDPSRGRGARTGPLDDASGGAPVPSQCLPPGCTTMAEPPPRRTFSAAASQRPSGSRCTPVAAPISGFCLKA